MMGVPPHCFLGIEMDGTDCDELTSTFLNTGQEALARGAWQEAYAAFESALAAQESPEALEGLGVAAAWLNDASALFDTRERAYRLFLERDDRRSAARVAVSLAMDHFTFRGEPAIANGWLQRARRLLAGLESSHEFGWLALCEAHIAVYSYDSSSVRRLSTQAASLAKSLGDINIEMLALAYEGVALVSQGKLDAGMRCLDEATTAIVAGEMTDITATCTACCCLLYTCQQVRDYQRAAQWCERLEAIAQRWSYPTMFSVCRTYYAGLLIGQGDWDRAETELTAAIHALETMRPAQAAEGLVRLGILRCRQGRFEEAQRLFARAEAPPFRALAGHLYLLGRATLALEQQDAAASVNLVERFLRTLPSEARMERAAGLELLIQAWAMRGKPDRAEEALAEMRAIVDAVPTLPMQGSVHFATGLVAASAGDLDTAKRCFEDAVEFWTQSGVMIEAAQARIELSSVLADLGHKDDAEQEVCVALDYLQSIGASRAVERALALLEQIDKPRAEARQASPLSRLTSREVEVLRLVAQGLSNREISTQLVLSEHTVHRHVANILQKLDLSSRTSAAVYAAQHDLI